MKAVKNVKLYEISKHLLQCGCLPSFDYLDIWTSDTNQIRLVTKEDLFIKRDKTVSKPIIKSFFLNIFDQWECFILFKYIIREHMIWLF